VFISGQTGHVSWRDQVKLAVKDKPQEFQAFALKVMDYLTKNNFTFARMYDPVKAAMAAIELREKGGEKYIAHIIHDADFRDIISEERAY